MTSFYLVLRAIIRMEEAQEAGLQTSEKGDSRGVGYAGPNNPDVGLVMPKPVICTEKKCSYPIQPINYLLRFANKYSISIFYFLSQSRNLPFDVLTIQLSDK